MFKHKDTLIEIKQGFNEIGGNFIIIKNKDNNVVFDQGIRFSRFKKFYNATIQPSSVTEMKKLKIIPPSDEYSKIFISHLHLDHLGVLHSLNLGTTLYVPDTEVFEKFIGPYKESNNWTAYISPPIGVKVVDVKGNNDNVTPLSVEHSAYPAYALYYDSGDTRILYSGDLRISSPLRLLDPQLHERLHHKTILEEYDEKGLDTDVLLLEGTNFSSASSPIQPHYFLEQIDNIFDSHENSLIIVSVDPIDLEGLATLLLKTKIRNRIPIFLGRRIIEMASFWNSKFQIVDKAYQIVDKAYQFRSEPIEFDIIDKEEVVKSPKDYVIFTAKGNLINLGRDLGDASKGSVIISTSTESKNETGEDESVEDNWYRMLGFITYRLRLSGHYYPYELKRILDTVKPKEVIPIHTEATDVMCDYVNKLGYKCANTA
ncbi:MBL fold metallo-hydrolase [Acidianus infernus]|nr:MBL fold metallo-hydrolase [Acidianus infernus]